MTDDLLLHLTFREAEEVPFKSRSAHISTFLHPHVSHPDGLTGELSCLTLQLNQHSHVLLQEDLKATRKHKCPLEQSTAAGVS